MALTTVLRTNVLHCEKNTINQHNHKLSSAWALWRWSPRHG